MPARDVAHEAVKHALIQDGWTITDDPLFLQDLIRLRIADLLLRPAPEVQHAIAYLVQKR